MNVHDATEQAYKNGYEEGYQRGKAEAVNEKRTSYWVISSDGYYPYCAACKRESPGGFMTDFCPHCGLPTKLRKIKSKKMRGISNETSVFME